MNAATITTATFRLRAAGSTADVPATVTVNAAGTLATLTPSSPLGAGTVYTATVTAAVTDAIGTPLGADSLWSFTTNVAPTVTAQAPAPGATGVPLNTTVTASFSKAMNAATITTATFRLRAAGSTADVPAMPSATVSRSLATLTPSSPFGPGTVYTATVTAAVTDAIGTPLGADSLWSFTTDVAPTVTVQAPAPGATGVRSDARRVGKVSKAMNAASITTATFRLRAAGSTADVPATVTVNAAGTLATRAPSRPVGAGTVYTATVTAAVTDAIGTPLGADSLWSFTTNVPPTVTVQAPAPGATGVPLNTTVTASFSKAMNAATITTATFRLRAAGSTADVPATVTVNAAGTLATLTPSSPLGAGTVYTANVAGSVTDAIGTPLGADSLWSFTTNVPPTVTVQAPAPGATGVPLNTTVTASFSKEIGRAHVTKIGRASRREGITTAALATVTVNAAGTLATLTRSSPLVRGTGYSATVAAAVADAIGTPLGADSLWSFTTDVAPTVTAQAPAPGATGVPLNTTVTASFSKAMNAATITTATFRLRAAGSTARSEERRAGKAGST